MFLVLGIPEDQRVRDSHFFMANLAEKETAELSQLVPHFPVVEDFLRKAKDPLITCVGFRNSIEKEKDAVRNARFMLSGILDGLSVLDLESIPTVCPVVFIREEGSDDNLPKGYAEDIWLWIHPKAKKAADLLKYKNDGLSPLLFGFYDIAAGEDCTLKTDLGIQLLYSARMFRKGKEIRAFGIEFFCKFSALEGLVCGGLTNDKLDTLKKQLCQLFDGASFDVSACIKKLWELRCSVSHQAKAFYADEIAGAFPVHIEMDNLDHYFFGVFVFALSNLDKCKTIEELWKLASDFDLPYFASKERREVVVRFPASASLVGKGLVWKSVGQAFDKFYQTGTSSGKADETTPPTVTQRDYMRTLFQDFGDDEEKLVKGYVEAEEKGIVKRKPNRSGLESEQYARALLKDGRRKKWLFIPPRKSTN